MARWIITAFAMTCIGTSSAQNLWTSADIWLQQHHTEVSIAPMLGISYFQYDTKAIEPHFVTPELSLEFLFSTRVAEHWKVQYGIVASYKGTSAKVYDQTPPYEALIYRLKDIDSLMSQVTHGSWGLPIKVQYHPGKFGLTLGVLPRYFVVNNYSWNYPVNLLKGKYDFGIVAGIGFPFGSFDKFRFGFEYYHGFVNMYNPGSWVVIGGPQYVDYRLFNRSGQFLLRCTLGKAREQTMK